MVLETSLVILSLTEEECADILYNFLKAIHKTICAFDTDKTRQASTAVIEILSISCFMPLLGTADRCNV